MRGNKLPTNSEVTRVDGNQLAMAIDDAAQGFWHIRSLLKTYVWACDPDCRCPICEARSVAHKMFEHFDTAEMRDLTDRLQAEARRNLVIGTACGFIADKNEAEVERLNCGIEAYRSAHGPYRHPIHCDACQWEYQERERK